MESDVLSNVMEACDRYKDLEWCFITPSCIEVVRTNFTIAADPCRPFRPVRILATDDKIILEVLFRVIKECISPKQKEVVELLQTLSAFGQHSFCPGLAHEDIQRLQKAKAKNAVRTEIPCARIAASNCLLYFGYKKRQSNFVPIKTCANCAKYMRNVHYYDATNAKTPERSKRQQAQVNSRTPFSRITPTTRRLRLQRASCHRYQLKKKITRLEAKLRKHDVQLNHDQHKEMKSIHSIISQDFAADLDQEVSLCGDALTTKQLRQAWHRDRRMKHAKDTVQFFSDQAKGKTGSKRNRWSLITYRLALAVFLRSPAAYEALKSFRILQLPSTDTLRTFTRQRLSSPGIGPDTHAYLKDQMVRYELLQAERAKKGERTCGGFGVIVFDEVKVVDKVCWNSKNHELIGLAMCEEDYSSLHDVYSIVKDNKRNLPTSYVLQFLWRDLQQKHDIVGPWFSFPRTIEAKQLLPCVVDTLKAFHVFGFKCLGLVCDGASSNLSTIKHSTLSRGQYASMDDNMKPTVGVPVGLDPSFTNPCDFRLKVHWIICPSHQLKNMVNALHASRRQGTKELCIKKTHFGWKAIQDLYQRELKRVANNASRKVPKLQKAYVVRDAWTKLNVKPARIMIQEHVLSELEEYVHPNNGTAPPDAANVKAVIDYLTAVRKIFDFGLLSKDKLKEGENDIILNIREGMSYFYNWMQGLLDTEPDFKPADARQKKFISWQTWDLLRIAAYGFLGLHAEFAVHCPGDFFYPVKVNGSAVETLFSQMKFSSAGKLSGANYSQARRNLLIKSDVHGPVNRRDYRLAPLAIANEELKQVRKPLKCKRRLETS